MNKRKNGFTLIELLAVIVVLAILALIAVPIVLNIIKDARNNSNKRSIESYARALDYAVSEYMSENPDVEVVTWEDVKDKVEYKGKVECQWGENLSSISSTGEITLHGCKVNNKTNSLYGYVNGKVTQESDIVYSAYNVGDEITYNGMKFYVISPSDTNQDYVTLLKETPLTSQETTTYGSTSTYVTSNGYGGVYYDNTVPESSDYATSDIKNIVNAWVSDKLNENDLKEVEGYKARLITFDELTNNLGYETQTCGTSECMKYTEITPSWVYNSDYYYWTMSSANDSYSSMWSVRDDGRLTYGHMGSFDSFVVRPVINLKKSAIK